MTALANCDEGNFRTKHRSWDVGALSAPMFDRQITLDPCDVEGAWEQLSLNTAALEFQSIPLRLHRSLVKALRRGLSGAAKP